jgi:hypothetical protein
MEDNAEVLISYLPLEWKEEEIKCFISNSLGKPIEEIFAPNTMIKMHPDTRPDYVNSHGQ